MQSTFCHFHIQLQPDCGPRLFNAECVATKIVPYVRSMPGRKRKHVDESENQPDLDPFDEDEAGEDGYGKDADLMEQWQETHGVVPCH